MPLDRKAPPEPRITAPFGALNRQRLIAQFLNESNEAPWLKVYRLLLWTDKTTGLAHCYESDKCQPGKPWHSRSLRFHAWLADSLGLTPRKVAEEIDWLFRRTADDYARYMVQRYQALLRLATQQRAPYIDRAFPEPGEDPAIVEIIRQVLGTRLSHEPSPDEWRAMTQRIRELIAIENKRKNLVGEGFEDVLSAITREFDAFLHRLLMCGPDACCRPCPASRTCAQVTNPTRWTSRSFAAPTSIERSSPRSGASGPIAKNNSPPNSPAM